MSRVIAMTNEKTSWENGNGNHFGCGVGERW